MSDVIPASDDSVDSLSDNQPVELEDLPITHQHTPKAAEDIIPEGEEVVPIEEEIEVPIAPPRKLKTYGEMTKAYWYQFIDPKIWRTMPICLGLGFAFWALKFIPNYEKCMLSPSIFAIIGGVIVAAIPKGFALFNGEFFHPGVAFSKGMFMRLAVVFYGFKTKLTDIESIGAGGIIGAILMVIFTFALGWLVGKLLKMRIECAQVISTGFAICGIAAIMSSSGIFMASSADVSLACIFVIVGGFIDIAIYPSMYQAVDKLFGNDKNFGFAAGVSIKEIAHTVSVGLSCSEDVSKYAMIVKMFKVLLLPFMLIILSVIIPMTRPKDEALPTYDKCSDKVLDFFNKVTIPYFAFIFIIMTVVNSYVYIAPLAYDAFDHIIIIALSTSMFCVGVTTDLRQLLKGTGWKPFALFGILYVWVFLFGWFLEHFLHDV